MGRGLDYDELFPGRFLKASDLKDRDVNLTIKAIRIEMLPQDKGGEKVKGIIAFGEAPKELVLNKTNGTCMKAMWGRDTGDWVGHKVTLCVSQWNGEPCIRIRGSPDLKADKDIEIHLPKRKPLAWTLKKTAGKAGRPMAAEPPPPAPAEPEPPSEGPEEKPLDDVPGWNPGDVPEPGTGG